MNVHEYQAKELLKEHGIAVPDGHAALTVEEAVAGAKKLPGPLYVVKAQIHAGGRGKGKFKELADKHTDLLYAVGRQMADRLCRTTQKVSDLAFLDVTGRVARTLLELTKQPDAMTHPDGMQIKITRQEIGRIVGCSREMVGRVLKTLVDQGLVSVKGKTMVVFGTR